MTCKQKDHWQCNVNQEMTSQKNRMTNELHTNIRWCSTDHESRLSDMKTSSSDPLKCLIFSLSLCFCFFLLSSLNIRVFFFSLTEMNSEASLIKLNAVRELTTWQSLKCTERLSRVSSHWNTWVSFFFSVTFISSSNCLFSFSHSSFKVSSLFWIKVSNKWLTAQAAVTYSMYINSNQPLCCSCNLLKHSQLVLLIWLESFTDDDENAVSDLLLKSRKTDQQNIKLITCE